MRWLFLSTLICVLSAIITYLIASRIVILLGVENFIVKNIIALFFAILYDISMILLVPSLVIEKFMIFDVDEDRLRKYVAKLSTVLAICIAIFVSSV